MPIQLISLGSAPDDGTGTSLHAGGAIINENFLLLRDMISGVISGFDLQGGWDASTNTPALESGVGTTGHAYMVTVAGGTELDGVSDWQVGESLVFAGDAWVRTLTVGIPVSEKGAANGVPTLDAGAVVPLAQVPTIPVAKGGTGRATLTTGSYLRGAGTGEVALRTAAETLEDIGAAALADVVSLAAGEVIPLTSADNLNSIAESGLYGWWNDIPANAPYGRAFLLNLTGELVGQNTQVVFPADWDWGLRGEIRYRYDDTSGMGWSLWVRVYDQTTHYYTILGGTGTLNLNCDARANAKTATLTGNITFTTSNLGSGRGVTVKIINGATERTMSFPAAWRFVGAKPSSIAPNKIGILTLLSDGAMDSNVVAAYAEEE